MLLYHVRSWMSLLGSLRLTPVDSAAQILDALLPEMENLRGKLVVVFAGYRKQMEGLMAHNEGLPSRFPLVSTGHVHWGVQVAYYDAMRSVQQSGNKAGSHACHVLPTDEVRHQVWVRS